MSSTFGHVFRINSWGESHGEAVGLTIDGCIPNLPLDESDIQKELDRRKPGQTNVTTKRNESDSVKILSGVFEGKTTGCPISMIVYNKDQKSKSYYPLASLYRPGHADYTYQMKYGIRDYRGGGRSSGRETIARVAAGAVAKKILKKYNISIFAYAKSIGDISITEVNLDYIEQNPVRCPDPSVAKKMEELILACRKKQSSVGGIVEVIAFDVPAGLGEPVFDKLDADIAKGLMSIGAVKGVEIGSGFALAKMTGEKANDEFYTDNNNIIKTKTNHAGGILGGISNGMPIITRVAVKPTPSIAKEQDTVDKDKKAVKIKIKGRHDPCIVPRIIPVIENMVAVVICDHLLRQKTLL